MNQAIVTRYDDKGEQTRGYNKILTAIQCFEEILIAFEQHTCRKWSQALAQAKEPSWWQRNIREMDKEDVLVYNDDGYYALRWLFKKIERDTLTDQDRSLWISMESVAFDGKVDVARHYRAYDNLRNIIRCGSMFFIDDETARFVNTFNKRLTIFH
ncbi:MAG: hypothetical protein Tp1111DCM1126091_51 [Prokaryotic dsDNA virus sp.]|nr:MAG: hypothetical protein Tp1111DCM1126091_51 [Prokaryotic dsDNA virus sp.]|tara:strand:+ start:79977 stop:80444 length:468 start_codon:yes stop_codon:yes gene_type:complete